MLKKTTFLFFGLSILVLFMAACTTTAEAPSVELTETSYVYIPDTISEEAQAVLRMLPDPSLQPELPAPNKREKRSAWKDRRL